MGNQEGREIFYFKIPVFISDLAIHFLTLFLVLRYGPSASVLDIHQADAETGIFALLFLSFAVSIAIFDLRLHDRKIHPIRVVSRAIGQTLTCYFILLLMLGIVYKAMPRSIITYQIFITLPIIATWHFIANRLVWVLRARGFNSRHVVLVGTDEVANNIYKELRHGRGFTGYRVMGFFTNDPNEKLPEGAKMLGPICDSYQWIEDHMPDEVYCSLVPSSHPDEINKLIRVCNENFINFYFVPTMDGYPHRTMTISRFGSVNVIKLHEEPMDNPFAKLYKRTFDILISLSFLVLIYPFVYIFVFIGTKLTSPGPIYFKQMRTGYNGQSFKIYKFRSMHVNVDSDKIQATKDDPRKTKFGDFLRRSSIDELPQFINVLKGDMSIIGPRPHMEYHTDLYNQLIGDYMVRHLAKPGITGWAQVNGFRGETRTVEDMQSRVEHDIWYIEHWTPLLDVEIFVRTLGHILPGNHDQAY